LQLGKSRYLNVLLVFKVLLDDRQCKVYSQVLQDVLHRVDKTNTAFFRRGRGFPGFKGKGWFDAFTDRQLGFGASGSQLCLAKIDNVKMKFAPDCWRWEDAHQ
jgi:hypothetical protein